MVAREICTSTSREIVRREIPESVNVTEELLSLLRTAEGADCEMNRTPESSDKNRRLLVLVDMAGAATRLTTGNTNTVLNRFMVTFANSSTVNILY